MLSQQEVDQPNKISGKPSCTLQNTTARYLAKLVEVLWYLIQKARLALLFLYQTLSEVHFDHTGISIQSPISRAKCTLRYSISSTIRPFCHFLLFIIQSRGRPIQPSSSLWSQNGILQVDAGWKGQDHLQA